MRVESLVISVTYTVLQATIAGLLWWRARATRAREFRFVVASFGFAAAAGILGVAWSGFRVVLNPLVAICMLPFVHVTFNRPGRRTYTTLLAGSLALFAATVMVRVIPEILMQEGVNQAMFPVSMDFVLVIYVLCFGWFLVECARAHRRIAGTKGVEPWVKLRYVLLALACGLAIATAVPPVLFEDQPSFRAGGWVLFVMATTNLLFSLASLVAWFVPSRIKAFMRAREPVPRIKPAVVHNLISHLGERLAPRIGQSPSAAKGLILVSLMAAEKHHADPGVNFYLLRDAVHVEVRKRLSSMGEPGHDDIVDELVSIVDGLRSMFVLDQV